MTFAFLNGPFQGHTLLTNLEHFISLNRLYRNSYNVNKPFCYLKFEIALVFGYYLMGRVLTLSNSFNSICCNLKELSEKIEVHRLEQCTILI